MQFDDNVGKSGNWEIATMDGPIPLSGIYLGFSSSRSPRHSPRAHPGGSKKPAGFRCSACRWSEFRIFREDDNGSPVDQRSYLVHFTGRSDIPGEKTWYRIADMLTAPEVIEVLTTRRDGRAYLSVPAGRVLAQAAAFDRGSLTEAYDARRVA